MKRLFYLLLGNTLSSFAIACVLCSGLGSFGCTAGNFAIANIFKISLGVASFVTESIMLAYATYKNEGIGWTAIVNATYGSFMIDIFYRLLPISPWMALFGFLLPIAWAYMGKAGWGDTGTNLAMRAIIKQTGKSIKFCRFIIDAIFLAIAFIGARNMITWFTITLTFGTGPVIQFIYKLIKYEPVDIEHKYLLSKKGV